MGEPDIEQRIAAVEAEIAQLEEEKKRLQTEYQQLQQTPREPEMQRVIDGFREIENIAKQALKLAQDQPP